MRKLILGALLISLCPIPAFASAKKPPADSFAGCLADADVQCANRGLLNANFPGSNDDTRNAWYNCSLALQNTCKCRYYGQPLALPAPWGPFSCSK